MCEEIYTALRGTARVAFRFFDDLPDAEREQVLLALVKLLPQREAELAQNALYHLQQQRKAGLALRVRLESADAAGHPAPDRSRTRLRAEGAKRPCVDFGEYLKAIVGELTRAHAAGATGVSATVNVPDLRLPVEFALPAGMIAHELVANALRHAFPGGRHGRIEVRVETDARRFVLTVADDGVGLPKELRPDETERGGWRLLRHLAHQLGATVDRASHAGTVVSVSFSRAAPVHTDFAPVSLLHAATFAVPDAGGCTCSTGACACGAKPDTPAPDGPPLPHPPSRLNTS